MSTEHKAIVRCAIYTRKSSEEGLEQSFNSLDAQREAGAAFIASQRQEGWKALPTLYDDGGYSGGTLERPALKRLLEDVEANRVDTIVVYKVDRLTRSLADFAKIVEALDARKVSTFSVNRPIEVVVLNCWVTETKESFASSGFTTSFRSLRSYPNGTAPPIHMPLRFEAAILSRILSPVTSRSNWANDSMVRDLYRLYLELGCVSKLKAHLDREGVNSKVPDQCYRSPIGGNTFFTRGRSIISCATASSWARPVIEGRAIRESTK